MSSASPARSLPAAGSYRAVPHNVPSRDQTQAKRVSHGASRACTSSTKNADVQPWVVDSIGQKRSRVDARVST